MENIVNSANGFQPVPPHCHCGDTAKRHQYVTTVVNVLYSVDFDNPWNAPNGTNLCGLATTGVPTDNDDIKHGKRFQDAGFDGCNRQL